MVILRIIDLGIDVEVPDNSPSSPDGATKTITLKADPENEGTLTQDTTNDTTQDPNEIVKIAHIATDWEIASNLSFSDVILKSEADKVNLTSIIFNEVLDPNKKWYARARVLLETGYTIWGNIDVILPADEDDVVNDADDMPTLVAVPQLSTNSNQYNHTPTMFTITASGFMVIGTAGHESTSWFIEDLDGNVIWSNLYNTIYKTSIEVNDILLKTKTVYRIKAIFHSTSGDSSSIASMPIQITDNDDILLLSYIDVIDPEVENTLEIAKIDGVTEVTWEIISFLNNFSQSVLTQTTTGDEYNKLTIPSRKLKQSSSFLLRIKTNKNGDNESNKYKYIPFNTKYVSEDYIADDIPPVFTIDMEPSRILLKTFEEVSKPKITSNYKVFDYTLSTTDPDTLSILPVVKGVRGKKDGLVKLKIDATAERYGEKKTASMEVDVLIETLPPTLNIDGIGAILRHESGAVKYQYKFSTEPLVAKSGNTELTINSISVRDIKMSPVLNKGKSTVTFTYNTTTKCIDVLFKTIADSTGFDVTYGCRYIATIDVNIGDGKVTSIPVFIGLNLHAITPDDTNEIYNYNVPKLIYKNSGRKAAFDINTEEGWKDEKYDEFLEYPEYRPTRDLGTVDDTGKVSYLELKEWNQVVKDGITVKLCEPTQKVKFNKTDDNSEIDGYYTKLYLISKYGDKYNGKSEGILTFQDLVATNEAGTVVPGLEAIELEEPKEPDDTTTDPVS